MHPLSVKPNVADSFALVVETVGGLGVGQADRTVGAAASSSPRATSCAHRPAGIAQRRATRSIQCWDDGTHARPRAGPLMHPHATRTAVAGAPV